MLPLALSNGDVILIVVFAAIPFVVLTFLMGAGHALGQIGKGQFAVEFESDLAQKGPGGGDAPASGEVREAEIRQLVEAKAYRQRARGEAPLDVEDEVGRLMRGRPGRGVAGDHDSQLREEVRQLVIARNARRARQGKEPLDVEAEVERQLRDLENLGQ
jgi:hypothetical protein